MDLSSIFLGSTSANRSKFLSYVFSKYGREYKKLVVPCVGTFKIPVLAIKNGIKVEDIYTSDISIYSHLLAEYCNGNDYTKVPFSMINDYGLEEEKDKIAYILYLIKVFQLREKVYYEKMYIDEMKNRKEVYIKKISDELNKLDSTVHGIIYNAEDLRDTIFDVWANTKNSILVLDPPMYKNGYKKMFDMGGKIHYNIEIEEFDPKKEYVDLLHSVDEIGKQNDSIVLAFHNQIIPEFKDRICFAEEAGRHKVIYIYSLGKEIDIDKHTSTKTSPQVMPSEFKVFSEDDVMTEDSQVRFVKVPVNVATYYRDLFAHKLGSTQADLNYLLLVDDKVHSVVGFETSAILKLQTKFIWEIYGFSVNNKKYPVFNRLLMMCITSVPMAKVLGNDMSSGINRFFNMKGLKTTCETPFRTLKSNQGVLKLILREKKPNGFYRLVFEEYFAKRSFHDCVVEYLNWIKNDYAKK